MLRRIVKETRLNHFQKQIDIAVEGKSCIRFANSEMSLDWAKAEFNMELHYLRVLIEHENYMLQALKNDGLDDTDIDNVMKGIYKREFDDIKPILGVVEKADEQPKI